MVKMLQENNNPAIYIHGEPGVGKSNFALFALRVAGFDPIVYDSCCVRNKAFLDNVLSADISYNIVTMFSSSSSSCSSSSSSSLVKKRRKMVVIMDDMDALNVGDRSGILAIMRFIKKSPTFPIVCIGNSKSINDKKLKQLVKSCNLVLALPNPTRQQMKNIMDAFLKTNKMENDDNNNVLSFVNTTLAKLDYIYQLHASQLLDEFVCHLQQLKTQAAKQEDKAQQIENDVVGLKTTNACMQTIHLLLTSNPNPVPLWQHHQYLYANDSSLTSLLWHENAIDYVDSVANYVAMMENICFADVVIDRVNFDKQIWQFAELSSIIKTFANQQHTKSTKTIKNCSLRFTKIVSKYSIECGYAMFIQDMCMKFKMDKKQLFAHIASSSCSSSSLNSLVSSTNLKRLCKYIFRQQDNRTMKKDGKSKNNIKATNNNNECDDLFFSDLVEEYNVHDFNEF